MDVTYTQVSAAYLKLRSAMLYGSSVVDDDALKEVMKVMEALAFQMRREAIFKAGAAAEKINSPVKFDGHILGSMELCTFYDGHASTYPEFKNPYRRG